MKRIVLIFVIIMVALLAACGDIDTEKTLPVPDVELPDIVPAPPPAEAPEPEIELPYAFVLSPDFDRSMGIFCPIFEKFHLTEPHIAFDLGELAWDEYPSGEWSVNELEEKYGKADEIRGSFYVDRNVVISVIWENKMYVSMQIPRNGMFSFDINSNSIYEFYPLSEDDMAIKIPIYDIWVYGEDMPLPRGLKIGQSTIEDVKAAYPVEEYDDILGDDVGRFIVHSYVYFDKIATKIEIEKSDIGYIKYRFDKHSGGDGILWWVEIALPSDLRSVGI